jgi:hypothetical protein
MGFQVDCGLENGMAHVPHLVEDGEGCRGHRLPIISFSLLLEKAFATVHQLPYDHVMVHGVPPDEMV